MMRRCSWRNKATFQRLSAEDSQPVTPRQGNCPSWIVSAISRRAVCNLPLAS